MEKMVVVVPIEEPTDWCADMVVAPKPNGKIRICSDMTHLNEFICRERHILPAVDKTLAKLTGAIVFSKLDATAGFWQVPLHPKSVPLTTFITPFGRYCYKRLLFGISSAPEHFQRQLTQMLTGLKGLYATLTTSWSLGQHKGYMTTGCTECWDGCRKRA